MCGERTVRRIAPKWEAPLLIAWGLCAVGCGPKPVPRVPPEIPTTLPSEEEARQVREASRETILLLPQGDRGMGEQDLPPQPELQAPEAQPPTQPPAQPTAQPPAEVKTRYGYRVQLFAASSEAIANLRAKEYQEAFEEEVYVEFEGLLYKVRVGDCSSRDEASALQRTAARLGHQGAFVVGTQVNVH